MRLLILGYSSIAERRVIPAAARVAAIDGDIDREQEPSAAGRLAEAGTLLQPITRRRLRDSNADIVYLSLPNAMHEALGPGGACRRQACRRRQAGDDDAGGQPNAPSRRRGAASAFSPRRRCSAITRSSQALGGFLAETRAADAGRPRSSSFRPCRSPTSAITASLAAAACSTWAPMRPRPMRILGGGAPSQITALAGGRHPETGVDMGFSVQARLANGGVFSGHFSFEGEYQNRLLIVGAFRLCDDRTRLQPARRSSHGMAPARPQRRERRDVRGRRYFRALPGSGDARDRERRSREVLSRSARAMPNAGPRLPQRSQASA